MTGQGYSARSEPNYRNWAVGALVAVSLIGSLWYACRVPKEVPPQETAASEPVPAAESRAEARRKENERVESLSSTAYRQTLDAAGDRIRDLTEEIARFRRAEEERGAYFPPPRTEVRHIGYPIVKRTETGWLVYGEWFNLGETAAAGYADIRLYAAATQVGEVQSVRLGPIGTGGRQGYQVTFVGVATDRNISLMQANADWRPL